MALGVEVGSHRYGKVFSGNMAFVFTYSGGKPPTCFTNVGEITAPSTAYFVDHVCRWPGKSLQQKKIATWVAAQGLPTWAEPVKIKCLRTKNTNKYTLSGPIVIQFLWQIETNPIDQKKLQPKKSEPEGLQGQST